MDLADLLNEAFPNFSFIASGSSKRIFTITKSNPPHPTRFTFKLDPWIMLLKNGWIYGPSRIVRLLKFGIVDDYKDGMVQKIVHIADPDFIKTMDLLLKKIEQSEYGVADDNGVVE